MQLLLNTIMLEPNRWTAEHALTWPLVDLLDPMAAAGFRDLEVWGYHLDRLSEAGVEQLAGALEARGMRAVGVGAYPAFHLEGAQDEEERRSLEQLVGAAVRLGASVFKIFPGRVASAEADETVWRRSVEGMRRLAGRAAEAGMLLTLETHGGTLCDTLDGTRRLLEQLPEAGVGICFQPYVEHDTAEAMAAFDALGSRVRHLHLQNRKDGAAALLEEGGLDRLPEVPAPCAPLRLRRPHVPGVHSRHHPWRGRGLRPDRRPRQRRQGPRLRRGTLAGMMDLERRHEHRPRLEPAAISRKPTSWGPPVPQRSSLARRESKGV